jgi:hypothetical protein
MTGAAHPGLLLGAVALGTFGLAHSATDLGKEALTMEGQHWIMLLIALVVGYVLGRIWTQPAQLVGLP